MNLILELVKSKLTPVFSLSYPNRVEIVEKGGDIVRIEYLYSEKKDDFTEISFSIQIDE